MPQVGKQKFPYTSAGAQQAQKHAKATGQKVNMAGYKKGGIFYAKGYDTAPWVNEYGYPTGGITVKKGGR